MTPITLLTATKVVILTSRTDPTSIWKGKIVVLPLFCGIQIILTILRFSEASIFWIFFLKFHPNTVLLLHWRLLLRFLNRFIFFVGVFSFLLWNWLLLFLLAYLGRFWIFVQRSYLFLTNWAAFLFWIKVWICLLNFKFWNLTFLFNFILSIKMTILWLQIGFRTRVNATI